MIRFEGSDRKLVRLIIYGAPATKKTKSEIGFVNGKPRVFPSKTWRRWVTEAKLIVVEGEDQLPIATPVNVDAQFYRVRNAGDAVGYYQGLADLLEICWSCRKKRCKCGVPYQVLADDKYLVSWDHSRLRKDKEQPRVLVTLDPV